MVLASALVSAEWLQQNLDSVVVLDASWHLPAKERDGRTEFESEHIPGARYFDYDNEIKDHDSEFPRMMPSADYFAEQVSALGISNDSTIVIYDTNEMFSAPRAWWMFKAMGHGAVGILNGGLQAWKDATYSIESGSTSNVSVGHYTANPQADAFVDAAYVGAALENDQFQVLDARSQERFDQAHMPHAGNLPYSSLIENGFIKDEQRVGDIISANVHNDKHLVCSCGSGVTACVLALGAFMSGHKNISVYDASWSEWGSSDEFPKA